MARDFGRGELTGLQLEVLQMLWQRGEATVAEVHEAFVGRGRKMAYTTAMTMCKRMADRGWLKYRQRDRAYVYSPAVKRAHVLKRMLGGIADRAFGGSEAELALAVLADARMDADELAELQKLLDAKRREMGKKGGRGK